MGRADNEVIPAPAAGVLEQVVDDEMIVFNPNTETYFTLNRTAREVWELADGTHTLAAIADELAFRYEMEAEAIIGDVADIIASFREAELI